MRDRLRPRILNATIRSVREEFDRVYETFRNVVGTLRSEGKAFEVYSVYVDEITDELVIEHEGGEKRL